MASEKFEIIKVTNRKNERNGNFPTPLNIGQIRTKPIQSKRLNKDWQKELGRNGWMAVEDYEKGIFAPYGIDPKKIEEANKVKTLEADNKEKDKKIAELEARLLGISVDDNAAINHIADNLTEPATKKTATPKTKE